MASPKVAVVPCEQTEDRNSSGLAGQICHDALELAEGVQRLNLPWICTYDHAAIELGLYPGYRRVEYKLPYTAQGRHRGEEVMFIAHDLILPPDWLETTEHVRLTQLTGKYTLHGVVTNTCGII